MGYIHSTRQASPLISRNFRTRLVWPLCGQTHCPFFTVPGTPLWHDRPNWVNPVYILDIWEEINNSLSQSQHFFGGEGALHCGACLVLVPCPGMEPAFLQWEHRILTTGSPGKSQSQISFFFFLAMSSSLWYLSSLISNWTWALGRKQSPNHWTTRTFPIFN